MTLREQFEKETGRHAIDSFGEPREEYTCGSSKS